MIKDYEYAFDTGDKYEDIKTTPKISGCLKAVLIKCNKKPFSFEVQLVEYPALIILNDRSANADNIYIIPKMRIYNISEKVNDQKTLDFVTLNDKIYLRLHGAKNLKGTCILRVEE